MRASELARASGHRPEPSRRGVAVGLKNGESVLASGGGKRLRRRNVSGGMHNEGGEIHINISLIESQIFYLSLHTK